MTKDEKALFFALCTCRYADADTLRRYLRHGEATSAVLGALFWNRMAGTAYHVLAHNRCLDLINREFRNALTGAYEQNQQQNTSFKTCLKQLDEVLAPCRGRYAMLKGAYLCQAYPPGCRTSNDVDLLVARGDVSAVGEALTAAGFAQGHIVNGDFVPATRREIVESSMMRGETVPFIRRADLPMMPYLEVDLNFSLDYKSGDASLIESWIAAAQRVRQDELEIVTLDAPHFLLHLCEHLYKEAMTYPWIRMKRDMTLYKFADIHFLLADMTRQEGLTLLQHIRAHGAQEACSYAIYGCKELFHIENDAIDALLSAISPGNRRFLDVVQDPENHRELCYTQGDIVKRFWHANRAALLEVV